MSGARRQSRSQPGSRQPCEAVVELVTFNRMVSPYYCGVHGGFRAAVGASRRAADGIASAVVPRLWYDPEAFDVPIAVVYAPGSHPKGEDPKKDVREVTAYITCPFGYVKAPQVYTTIPISHNYGLHVEHEITHYWQIISADRDGVFLPVKGNRAGFFRRMANAAVVSCTSLSTGGTWGVRGYKGLLWEMNYITSPLELDVMAAHIKRMSSLCRDTVVGSVDDASDAFEWFMRSHRSGLFRVDMTYVYMRALMIQHHRPGLMEEVFLRMTRVV